MLRKCGALARGVMQGFIAVLIAMQCVGGGVLPAEGVKYSAELHAAALGQHDPYSAGGGRGARRSC